MRDIRGWVVGAALASFLAVPGLAVADITGDLFSGFISVDGGNVSATDGWMTGNFTISWEVEEDPAGTFTYIYEITVEGTDPKDLSHLIIEVSSNFEEANILTGTTEPNALGTFDEGSDNPNIPSPLYGLKFDGPNNEGFAGYPVTITIVTDREPMWGSFYAKDGKDGGKEGIDVYAYNVNFGNCDQDTGAGCISVPDTENGTGGEIPEPATLLLLGTGLAAAGGWQARRRRRA